MACAASCISVVVAFIGAQVLALAPYLCLERLTKSAGRPGGGARRERLGRHFSKDNIAISQTGFMGLQIAGRGWCRAAAAADFPNIVCSVPSVHTQRSKGFVKKKQTPTLIIGP